MTQSLHLSIDSLFDELQEEFGFLVATIRQLESTPFAPQPRSQLSETHHNQHQPTQAFRMGFNRGVTIQDARPPRFVYDLCLVHIWSKFEQFLLSVIRQLLQKQPLSLLGQTNSTPKSISILTALQFRTRDELISHLVDRAIHEYSYGTTESLLSALRTKHGLSKVPATQDKQIIQYKLVRNCIVHNNCVCDSKLEHSSNLLFREGQTILLDSNYITRAITILTNFSTSVRSNISAKPKEKKD